ncbi:MAG: glycosyltransferase [Nitrososphaerota archaeon]|jgi:glycosyltransferase involved in cell wall biosynthesis|nr:glycosyltransferase [Nitrososphaerota archaeon]
MNRNVHDNSQHGIIKKILVVHPYFNDVGGAEEVLLKVLESLIEQKQDCFLLGELPSGNMFDNLLISGIKQIRYDFATDFKPKRFQTHHRLFRHLQLKGKIRRRIGKVNLEIGTQDPMYFIGVGKKRVMYLHFPENLTRMQKSNSRYRWFWYLFYLAVTFQLKRQMKGTDLLLCNSLYTKNAIREYYGREAELVYPPVDVEDFMPAQKESLVISVGRFVPAKNYELIIQVAGQMPNVKFVLVGRKHSNDPYYDKINSLKPDNVNLVANATRADVIALLGKAKIYLHSRIGESFGISVAEAMAAGCIPVVHNSGGPKEIAGSYGFFYNNIEECVKAINDALQSNVKPNDIAERTKMFSSYNFKKNFVATLEKRGFL